MQNIVINMCEKFHYDRLRNDRALGTENLITINKNNNNNNNNNNNAGSVSGPVSGSKNQRSTEFRLRFRFRRRMWKNGHFRRTFGFGRKQSYHIRCTFGFGMLLLVNSVVAESRAQSLSCGGRECARRRESLASLCTD